MGKRVVVYIDESGFAHDMPRIHECSPVEDRCYGAQGWNAKGCKNVMAGLFGHSLVGRGIIEANVSTNISNTWIEKISILDLPHNSVIVINNAPFHKKINDKV